MVFLFEIDVCETHKIISSHGSSEFEVGTSSWPSVKSTCTQTHRHVKNVYFQIETLDTPSMETIGNYLKELGLRPQEGPFVEWKLTITTRITPSMVC